jgi:hypothetical protein
MATLDELVTATPFSELIRQMKPIRQTEETWIVEVRPELVQALAALDTNAALRVAESWAATDEWRLDRGETADLADLITRVSSLARRAAEGQGLFYWISL